MKRRMTREEYEALLQKCCKRGLISSSYSDLPGEHMEHHISLGVSAALEELVEIEEPYRRADAGWATLGVPSSTEVNLKAYLIELEARVRKLEGR